MELNDKHIRKSLYTNDCIQWFFNMFIKMHRMCITTMKLLKSSKTDTAIKIYTYV